MMKCFLLDLLGRDTNEAMIFEKTISKGIKSTRVVSLQFKIFMIGIITIDINYHHYLTTTIIIIDIILLILSSSLSL